MAAELLPGDGAEQATRAQAGGLGRALSPGPGPGGPASRIVVFVQKSRS